MKIVILDAFTTNPGDLSWDWLEEYGSVTVYDRTPAENIVERAEEADILVTNKTPLPGSVLEQLPQLKCICLLSTGYNVVDCDYAKEKGIPVCNIPSYSTNAVAQLVFSFILSHSNQVELHSKAVHDGEWTDCKDFCFWKTPLMELEGKTLGIFGFGKIGQRVSELANAFGMRVLACTPHPKDVNGVEWVSLDELIKESDFISLHCPLTEQTTGLVNDDFISKMKKSAFLINTSRGPVIDENALANALNEGKIAGAAVDVLSVEPPKSDNPLLTAKNCIITPHIAWAGHETRARLIEIFRQNISAFCNGTPVNVVNK